MIVVRMMKQVFDISVNDMSDVDLSIISDIENKCINNVSLTRDEAFYFLSYISYKVRTMLSDFKNKSLEENDFSGDCTNAQSILKYYFDSIGVKSIPVQTNKIFFNIIQHSFIIAYLLVDDNLEAYIVDPTYNQFFNYDKCLESNYVYRDKYVAKTPDPGYFILRESLADQDIIKDLLTFGFMRMDKESAEIYGNSFYYTQIGLSREEYDTLKTLGSLYMKFFLNSKITVSKDIEFLKENNLYLQPIEEVQSISKNYI